MKGEFHAQHPFREIGWGLIDALGMEYSTSNK
jgi:hypothetical protein